ncbi:hypothetical protein BSKO_06500 [Bryopsis sp. KO-2023]|nr:hypothetical protein BSKO_06500 [Bryopsis sp. KO-2023]
MGARVAWGRWKGTVGSGRGRTHEEVECVGNEREEAVSPKSSLEALCRVRTREQVATNVRVDGKVLTFVTNKGSQVKCRGNKLLKLSRIGGRHEDGRKCRVIPLNNEKNKAKKVVMVVE